MQAEIAWIPRNEKNVKVMAVNRMTAKFFEEKFLCNTVFFSLSSILNFGEEWNNSHVY